jgi:hypothetical protein
MSGRNLLLPARGGGRGWGEPPHSQMCAPTWSAGVLARTAQMLPTGIGVRSIQRMPARTLAVHRLCEFSLESASSHPFSPSSPKGYRSVHG